MRENTLCVLFRERPVSEVAFVFFISLTESSSKYTLFEDSTSNIKKKNPKQQQHNSIKGKSSILALHLNCADI